MRIHGLALTLVFAIAATGCFTEEKKQAQEAMKQLEQAQKNLEQAAKAMEKASEASGGSAEEAAEAAAQGAPENFAKAMEGMTKAMAAGGGNIDPVNFRELKKLLPEKVKDLNRKNASGERAAMGAIKVAHAKGSYEDGKKSVQLQITDMGTMKGFAAMAKAGWMMVDIDKESDDGYEKTTTYKSFKAHEKYNSKRKRGEMQVIVANRFIVESKGRNVEMDVIKAAVEGVDLKALEGMKDVGVKAN